MPLLRPHCNLFPLLGMLLGCILFTVGGLFTHTAFGQVDDPSLGSPDTPTDRSSLDHAKALFEHQQVEETLTVLEDFIENFPDSSLLDQAYFLQAAALRAAQQENEAAVVLQQLVEEFPLSPLVSEARLMLGVLYQEMGQPGPALAVLKNAYNLSSDTSTRREALRLMRQVYEQKGDYPQAIQAALAEIDMGGERDRGELLEYIQGLVLQQMDEPSLGALLDRFPSSFPGDLAMIRLLELHTAQGDEVLAERDIRSFLHRFPNHPYAQTAVALLHSFISKIKAHDHIIAAVLPFSGNLKPFGQDSLNGIRLALEEAKSRFTPNAIGLVVKDSATTPKTMRHEFSQLLEEFQPVAVIGPLLGKEVRLVADLAEPAQVPFITPSATLPNIRKFGRFWFSTALTAALQVQTIAKHAMHELGYRRFCILFPDTAYGQELHRLFTTIVERNGGEIIAAAAYQRGSKEVEPQITKLKNVDLTRFGEFTTFQLDNGEEREVYTPGFDAIFLPGQPVEVAFIAAQLAFYDMNVPLLGTNGWNSADLLKWGRNSIEGGVFVDGLFLQSPDPEVQDFIRRYRQRYSITPSIFALQAYDAMRVLIDALQQGATSGLDVREQLFRRHDLPTLGGRVAFGPGGVLHRRLYLIQITKGKFHQIN